MSTVTLCDYDECRERATVRITVEEIDWTRTLTRLYHERIVDACDRHAEAFRIGDDATVAVHRGA